MQTSRATPHTLVRGIAVALVGAVVLAVMAFSVHAQTTYSGSASPGSELTTVDQPGRVCTMDAKRCPDGSYVGRTGPNCEFAPCAGTIVPVKVDCSRYVTEASCRAMPGCEPYVTILGECEGSGCTAPGKFSHCGPAPDEVIVEPVDPAPYHVACPAMAKVCPDGSTVSPTGPNCEFPPCPGEPGDSEPGSVITPCPAMEQRCPDGSTVGPVGPNCEFAACPGMDSVCRHLLEHDCQLKEGCEARYGTPPCPEGMGCVQVVQYLGCYDVPAASRCEDLEQLACETTPGCQAIYADTVCPDNADCIAATEFERCTRARQFEGAMSANGGAMLLNAERLREREVRMVDLQERRSEVAQATQAMVSVDDPALSVEEQEQVMERVRRLMGTLGVATDRLDQVAQRARQYLNVVAGRGVDVAETVLVLEGVQQQINATKLALSELESTGYTILGTDDPRAGISVLRDAAYVVRDEIRVEQEALRDILAALRMSPGLQTAGIVHD